MRYLSLLLGFLYLGFLAFVPTSQAHPICQEDNIWNDGINADVICSFDHNHEHGQVRPRPVNQIDLDLFLNRRGVDDRRLDRVVKRYSESESRLIFDTPFEQYIVSAPFRAARAQLHPYFRNSPLQGYAPVYGYALTNPQYRAFVNDQAARTALGLPVQPVSPSAVCRNYSVFRYAQNMPAFLESCN